MQHCVCVLILNIIYLTDLSCMQFVQRSARMKLFVSKTPAVTRLVLKAVNVAPASAKNVTTLVAGPREAKILKRLSCNMKDEAFNFT